MAFSRVKAYCSSMIHRVLYAMAREFLAELEFSRETIPPTQREWRRESSLPSPAMHRLEAQMHELSEKCDRQFVELAQRVDGDRARLVKQAKIIDYHSQKVGMCENQALTIEALRERIDHLEKVKDS